MPKNTRTPSWIYMTKDGITIKVPANRAARKAYKRVNKDEWLLPAVLKPYEKGEGDAAEKGKK